MKNIFIINAHHAYPSSKGTLNKAFVDQAVTFLKQKDLNVRVTTIEEGYDVQKELENHQWADLVILQTPVNWMGVAWTAKKYMDEVYSVGMGGILSHGDGRSRQDVTLHYGSGGTLTGKKYFLSLTFNAPKEAFNSAEQYLFQGKSVDDLFFPVHMNFRFFDMEALPTFAAYDVMKNPQIENDFKRFESHLENIFG